MVEFRTVNLRIATLSYTELEAGKKPFPLFLESCKEINVTKIEQFFGCKHSEAEMSCLSCYLGLIIGNLIPRENKYWKNYRIFGSILSIITAPSFVETKMTYLLLRYIIHLTALDI